MWHVKPLPHAAMMYPHDWMFQSSCVTCKSHAMFCNAFYNMLEFIVLILDLRSQLLTVKFSNALQYCDPNLMRFHVMYDSKLLLKQIRIAGKKENVPLWLADWPHCYDTSYTSRCIKIAGKYPFFTASCGKALTLLSSYCMHIKGDVKMYSNTTHIFLYMLVTATCEYEGCTNFVHLTNF